MFILAQTTHVTIHKYMDKSLYLFVYVKYMNYVLALHAIYYRMY